MAKTPEQNAPSLLNQPSENPENVAWAISYLGTFTSPSVSDFIDSQLTPSMRDKLIQIARALKCIREGQ